MTRWKPAQVIILEGGHGHGNGRKVQAAGRQRKAVLVTEIIQRKTSVAETRPVFDIPPSEIEE